MVLVGVSKGVLIRMSCRRRVFIDVTRLKIIVCNQNEQELKVYLSYCIIDEKI